MESKSLTKTGLDQRKHRRFHRLFEERTYVSALPLASFSPSSCPHHSTFWNILKEPASELSLPWPPAPQHLFHVCRFTPFFPTALTRSTPLRETPVLKLAQSGGGGWGSTESNVLQEERLQSLHLDGSNIHDRRGISSWIRGTGTSDRLTSGVPFSSRRPPPRQAPCPLIWVEPECYKCACIRPSPACLRASVWNARGASACEVPKPSFMSHFYFFWQAG